MIFADLPLAIDNDSPCRIPVSEKIASQHAMDAPKRRGFGVSPGCWIISVAPNAIPNQTDAGPLRVMVALPPCSSIRRRTETQKTYGQQGGCMAGGQCLTGTL